MKSKVIEKTTTVKYICKNFVSVPVLFNEKLVELEEYCLREPWRHAFALWDLRKERENTDFYIYWEGRIRGYMLIYRGAATPSVILQGTRNAVKELLNYFEEYKAIVHMPYQYRDMWRGKNRIYMVDVMVARPQFYFLDPEVREIRDPHLLTRLFQNPEYLVKKALVYGIIKNGFVVSTASALAYLPEIWVLGAVITKKEYRGRGFASRVVGHFMSIASKHTRKVVLWVRSDNYVAIKLYKKYGFEKMGEDAWINVGVNVIP